MLAAEKGRTDVVTELIGAKARIEVHDKVRAGRRVSKAVMTPRPLSTVHVCCCVVCLQDGETAHMLAARNGHAEVIEKLITAGAKIAALNKVGSVIALVLLFGPYSSVSVIVTGVSSDRMEGRRSCSPLSSATWR